MKLNDLFDFLIEVCQYFLIFVLAVVAMACVFAAVVGFIELMKGHFVWYLIPSIFGVCAFMVIAEDA